MLRFIISVTVSCAFLISVLDCQDRPKYSDKCPKIKPVASVNDSAFASHWYLYATNNAVPFTCVNYEVTRVGPHKYHSMAKAKDLNGKILIKSYDWYVEPCDKPKGWVIYIESGYLEEPVMTYILDLDQKGSVISYRCVEDDDNGLLEELFVYTHVKADNPTHIQDVLKKNNLGHIKVDNTYVNCPKSLEDKNP